MYVDLIHPWIPHSYPFIVNSKNPNLGRVVIALWVRLDYNPNLLGSIKLCSYGDFVMFSYGLLDEFMFLC